VIGPQRHLNGESETKSALLTTELKQRTKITLRNLAPSGRDNAANFYKGTAEREHIGGQK
jgi:hypothetical protein